MNQSKKIDHQNKNEIDMNTIDVGQLFDISTLQLDNTIPFGERRDHIEAQMGNPYCFRYGEMGIALEFDGSKPSLQEVLTGLLIRKKSGM
jgi:hypothetical protein